MNLLLVGDACKDIFHYGKCDRICPEAPVPVFVNTRTVENAGMAGNVYNNLKSLGIETIDFIYNSEQITKIRFIDEKSNQMIVRVDENDKVHTSFDRLNLSIQYENYDATVISDYNKGFITLESIKTLSSNSKFSFVDTKKIITKEYFSNIDFIKINQPEWEFCKRNGVKLEEWEDKLLITMGSLGCKYKGVIYPVDTSMEVRDVSGAGDTWLASFVVKFLKTNKVIESIEYANKNATIVVQKKGVSVI